MIENAGTMHTTLITLPFVIANPELMKCQSAQNSGEASRLENLRQSIQQQQQQQQQQQPVHQH